VTTRYDVSGVPPQGGYVAKQCPVRAQWDAIEPCEPLPVSAALERRFARGRQFEREIVERLLGLHGGARVIGGAADRDEEAKARREAETLDAMRAGVPLILGGRLPADLAHRRVGEPDVLVAAANGAGYRPVDIKHHRCLGAGPEGLPALCSELDLVAWEAAGPRPDSHARKRRADLLQLAHYQRMLEAIGMTPPGGRHGGIIGTDGVLTWFDLDAPCWLTPSSTGRPRRRSTMDVYGFEFDFRLDIIAVASRHLADPGVTPLVVPVKIAECPQCPWWSWCGPALQAGSGDVSLVPRVGWRAWQVHHAHGVIDRAALAALDHRTAALVAAGVDLRPVVAALGTAPDQTPLEVVVGPRRRAQLARLAAAGMVTLGDARDLDIRAAGYSDEPLRDLPEQIDQARAALGRSPAYRRRDVQRVSVPRADVEVDVDMESTEDGVYLWGALVTGLAGWSGYLPFVTWEPMSPAAEAELFGRFWAWLDGLRAAAATAGLTFIGYCYNAAAESSQMRRLAAAGGERDAVECFIASRHWVDLLRVLDAQIITGTAIGLKEVAPLAGFGWDVDEPGGEQALLRYDEAVAGGERALRAREWLLAYNRGDVEAARAVRDWLDHAANDCPPVESLGG